MVIDNIITALIQGATLPEVLLNWYTILCTWKSMYPTTSFTHLNEFSKEAVLFKT